jgi:redox-sensitive bicupin YhaK (pirin superfamily)
MIDIRPFSTLGAFRNDWLNAKHHFSFGHYRDAKRMGFGALRVWNDDEVQPGKGFDPHPHQNMEIITFVRQGAITHKDSLGNQGATRAGDVQVMHAGTGITHAEYNLEDEATRLFQIWIVPDEVGVKPGWGAREFPRATGDGLQVLASGRPDDKDSGALPLYANAAVLAAKLRPGEATTYELKPGRAAYLVPAVGEIKVNGKLAHERDGVALHEEPEVTIEALGDAEIVLVDVSDHG